MSEKPLESADPGLSSRAKETLLSSSAKETLLKLGKKLHILIGHPWKMAKETSNSSHLWGGWLVFNVQHLVVFEFFTPCYQLFQ